MKVCKVLRNVSWIQNGHTPQLDHLHEYVELGSDVWRKKYQWGTSKKMSTIKLFWVSCDNYSHMLEGVLKAPTMLDGAEPTMDKAWLVMKNLDKHLLSLWNPTFNLAYNLATLAKEDFYRGWHMMTTNFHYVDTILNPYLLDDFSIHNMFPFNLESWMPWRGWAHSLMAIKVG